MKGTITAALVGLLAFFSLDAIASDSDSTTYVVNEAPALFQDYKVKPGDTVGKIVGENSDRQEFFLKVNRIDARHLRKGSVVQVPVEWERAMREYIPVPEQLADFRRAREIRVFLEEQYFGAYENGRLVFWGPVSSGRRGHRTPTGTFAVNYKQRYKRSIKYDNAPMPYSLNFHGGYFMHQQSMPGYPASHGCVRLLMSDAARLFDWARVGDAVTVVKVAADTESLASR
jgi:hypothetical protein